MSMFKLCMHPASDGDCLVLTWGTKSNPRRALIDFGRPGTYKAVKGSLEQGDGFELCVITHIDADHIGGAVSFFREKPLSFSAKHIWFNAYHQLAGAYKRQHGLMPLSPAQAEKVTAGIADSGWRWNGHFESRIVSTDSPEARTPLTIDGLKITLLSPSDEALIALQPAWDRQLAAARIRTTDSDVVDEALAGGLVALGPDVDALAAARFAEDDAVANGSSIAFLAEYEGRSVLLAGDAHPGLMERKLKEHLDVTGEKRLRIDCLKVSHHGSRANTSPEFLKLIDCTCFAFSTDGSNHNHPDDQAIARILQNDPGRKKTLIFNYRQPQTEKWSDKKQMKEWKFECIYPESTLGGIEFNV